ncbi:tetratricopeptide repeat protein [Mesorhizobium abyssinicae]|uniref:tetratricopeptide repeat protein n=1 Tax=Mesorhizobium abyssinicae TaxID=1209958 RepID=UPI00339AFEF7
MKEVGEAVRRIKQAWKDKDYPGTATLSRRLLGWEPGNIFGLLYLARAAAYTGEWKDVAEAGAAIVPHSPRDAFNAGRKLNRAGQTLQAAQIYAKLEIHEDWFDAAVADLAWKEGVSLLKAGQIADKDGNHGLAKVLWVAGLRIAPRNEVLARRVRQLVLQAIKTAKGQDRNKDVVAYADAWREVLWLSPSDVLAAAKLAWAHERLDHKDAIDAWLKVLAIAPTHEKALDRLRYLALRHDLEDRAVRGLVQLDQNEAIEALVKELSESRDAKARESQDSILKVRLREALARARGLDRDAEPRSYLGAWKDVLVLDPMNLGAAKKIVQVARQLGDYSELLEGLITLLEITPDDTVLRGRLIKTAQRAGREQRALEWLADHGLANVPKDQVQILRKRVFNTCKHALRASDLDAAMGSFRTLQRIDGQNSSITALKPAVLKRAVSSAWEAEKAGNPALAVPLARQVLDIEPDHPIALKIVARDLLRHDRCEELVTLCQPFIKPGPEYVAVQKLLDRASAKLAC